MVETRDKGNYRGECKISLEQIKENLMVDSRDKNPYRVTEGKETEFDDRNIENKVIEEKDYVKRSEMRRKILENNEDKKDIEDTLTQNISATQKSQNSYVNINSRYDISNNRNGNSRNFIGEPKSPIGSSMKVDNNYNPNQEYTLNNERASSIKNAE